jgi:hypothetical protein
MSYVELEQFLDRGSIRAWWGLSWRTFFGCAGGAVLGQQLGTVLFGAHMAGVALLTLVGAALGLTLLLKRRGIIVARRLLVLAGFGLRVARRRTVLDGALLAGRVDAHAPPPIQIRVREPVSIIGDDDADGAVGAERRTVEAQP